MKNHNHVHVRLPSDEEREQREEDSRAVFCVCSLFCFGGIGLCLGAVVAKWIWLALQ